MLRPARRTPQAATPVERAQSLRQDPPMPQHQVRRRVILLEGMVTDHEECPGDVRYRPFSL